MNKVMEVQPTVLLYNLQEGERAQTIRRYLTGAGIRIIDVLPAEYMQRLGALLELPGFSKDAAPNIGFSFPEEMLARKRPLRFARRQYARRIRCLPPAGRRAMFAFTDKVMEDFFQSFRDAKIASVGLKAAITPTNINWTSKQLYEAISEEHARVMAAKK